MKLIIYPHLLYGGETVFGKNTISNLLGCIIFKLYYNWDLRTCTDIPGLGIWHHGLGYPPFFSVVTYIHCTFFSKKNSIENTILLLGTGYTCLPFSLISYEQKIAEQIKSCISIWRLTLSKLHIINKFRIFWIIDVEWSQ